MNIGIITQWFASGAGHVSRSYAEVLSKSHSVFIYARGGQTQRGDPVWDGAEVTWAPHHPCLTGIYERHFTRWVKRHGIDAVLFNEQRHWAGVVLAKYLNLLTGAYVDYYTQNTRPFFNLYDFLICNTRRHYDVFRDHPQCCYVPWGVRTELNKPAERRHEGPLRFLVSAGFGGRKGALDRRGSGMAMRVFRRIRGNCRLIVYSQVPLIDCREDWQEAVREDDRIEFREGTYDPFPYTAGDVYVYPSRLDGIGLTLPEALSSGLPAIATDCAPMNEFVRNEQNGLLVKVKSYLGRPDGYYWPESICDEGALYDAFRYYVEHQDVVILHGGNARAIAEKELAWGNNAAHVGDWLPLQIKRVAACDTSFMDLATLACLHDRQADPTPLQTVIRGFKALVNEVILKTKE